MGKVCFGRRIEVRFGVKYGFCMWFRFLGRVSREVEYFSFFFFVRVFCCRGWYKGGVIVFYYLGGGCRGVEVLVCSFSGSLYRVCGRRIEVSIDLRNVYCVLFLWLLLLILGVGRFF